MPTIPGDPRSRPAVISYQDPTSQTGTRSIQELTVAGQMLSIPNPKEDITKLASQIAREFRGFRESSKADQEIFLSMIAQRECDRAKEQLARTIQKTRRNSDTSSKHLPKRPGEVSFINDGAVIAIDQALWNKIQGMPGDKARETLWKFLLTPVPSSLEHHSVEQVRGILTLLKAFSRNQEQKSSKEQEHRIDKWEKQLEIRESLERICARLETTVPELAWEFFSVSGKENPTLEILIEYGEYLCSQLTRDAQQELLREETPARPRKRKEKAEPQEILPYQPRDRGPGSRGMDHSSSTTLTSPVAVHPPIPLDNPDTERKMREGGFQLVRPAPSKDQGIRSLNINESLSVPLAPRVLRWNPAIYESREALLAAIRQFPDGNRRYLNMNNKQLLDQLRRHYLPGIEILFKHDWFRNLYLVNSDSGTSFALITHTYPDANGNPRTNPVKEILSINEKEDLYHVFLHPKDGIPPPNAPIFRSLEQAPLDRDQESSQEPASRTRVVSGETPTFSFEELPRSKKKLPAIRVSFRDPFLGPTSYLVIPK